MIINAGYFTKVISMLNIDTKSFHISSNYYNISPRIMGPYTYWQTNHPNDYKYPFILKAHSRAYLIRG